MNLFYTFLLSAIIVSCNFSSKCRDENVILGRYKLNTQLTVQYNNNDTAILPIITSHGWEKVVLVAEIGKYHFESNEEYFRKYEGSWESVDIDGMCYLIIKQHKESRNIPLDPFSIAIKEDGKTIVLPFEKY